MPRKVHEYYISYYCHQHRKEITRLATDVNPATGQPGRKGRNAQGVQYCVYWDVARRGFRCATGAYTHVPREGVEIGVCTDG